MPSRSWKPTLRMLLKELRNCLLYWSGAYAWASFRLQRKRGMLALNVHRILPDEAMCVTNSPEGMLVRDETFWAMCKYIECKMRFAHPDELERPTESPRLPVLLTLDDGWQDNVLPLTTLAQRGQSAIVFVCTSRMGTSNPFWPELVLALWKHSERSRAALKQECGGLPPNAPSDSVLTAFKRMPSHDREIVLQRLKDEFRPVLTEIDSTMTWQQVEKLQASGIRFGSHGRTHVILPSLTDRELREELCDSRSDLKQFARQDAMFAYPNGDHDIRTQGQVATAGYRFAFANAPGVISQNADPMALPRINVSERKLTGPAGRFSRYAFLHATVWAAYCSSAPSGGVIVPARANCTKPMDRLTDARAHLS